MKGITEMHDNNEADGICYLINFNVYLYALIRINLLSSTLEKFLNDYYKF